MKTFASLCCVPAALLLIVGLSAAQTPLQGCMHGSALPPYGDPMQGSVLMWPNGVAPNAPTGYYIPPFTVSTATPRLFGPLDSEPMVTSTVDDPVVEAHNGGSLYVWVQTPVQAADPNVHSFVQSFPSGLTINDWFPLATHWLFLYIRLNGSDWVPIGEFELVPNPVPGIAIGGTCTGLSTQNVGWWKGNRAVTGAGIVTQDKQAAAWVGIETGVPGTFSPGDRVEVIGVWGVEDTPGSGTGGSVTAFITEPFLAIAQ